MDHKLMEGKCMAIRLPHNDNNAKIISKKFNI